MFDIVDISALIDEENHPANNKIPLVNPQLWVLKISLFQTNRILNSILMIHLYNTLIININTYINSKSK